MSQKSEFSLPAKFRHEKEKHKYLARFKKSWEKRFRPTRMEELYETVDLANYLIALEREQDAIDLMEYVTGLVEFDGNYNIWSPTGSGIVLLCRLFRLRKDTKKHKAALARIIENSFQAGDKQEYFEQCVSEHDPELQRAKGDTQKWGSHITSRHLMGLTYLRETGEKGFDHSGTYDLKVLDPLIEESYAVLREKLK